MILIDTRQQPGKHNSVERYLEQKHIPIDRCKLYVGDYAIANDMQRSVDTKSGVMELMADIMSEHHDTFSRELERAQAAGIRLLILVEEVLPPGGLEHWEAPKSASGRALTKASPAALKRALMTLEAQYGCRFRFCARRDAGRAVVEYLTEGILP